MLLHVVCSQAHVALPGRTQDALKLDLYRRPDGALVVVPSRFAHALPGPDSSSLRYVRTVLMDLHVLGDELVLEIGLHGFALARGADAALLRNGPHAAREPDAIA